MPSKSSRFYPLAGYHEVLYWWWNHHTDTLWAYQKNGTVKQVDHIMWGEMEHYCTFPALMVEVAGMPLPNIVKGQADDTYA